jgi:electron transfer flavoprotein alpha subunit
MTDEPSEPPPPSPRHVVALVKQIPVFEEMRLGPDGRLARTGLPLEMSAYCRRAVAQGVALARATGGTCTVVTMGPSSAEDVLREAVAFGADRGVHVCDPAFAGSDTLATARALAATVRLLEDERGAPFDLVLAGRSSVDADTGQVGPELAQLLDRSFVTGVKQLAVGGPAAGGDGLGWAAAVLEHDDSRLTVRVALPAVLSTAERLIDPCKIKDPAVWATVDADRLRVLAAADLGPGPWGQDGSPTWVGETRAEVVHRAGVRLDGPLAEQVDAAVALLVDRGLPGAGGAEPDPGPAVPEPVPAPSAGVRVAVVVEAGRPRHTRELLGAAARLAGDVSGRVVALGDALDRYGAGALTSWGADEAIDLDLGGAPAVEEDLAALVAGWAAEAQPWALLIGSTAWGREVGSRVAAALGAGLTGDAVGFAVEDQRLVAWKPAFGGGLVAAIRSTSAVQLATVRAGVLNPARPRPARPRGRVLVDACVREDDVDDLLNAPVVIGVGQGVAPEHYGELDELLALLHAELGATRKVTDRGWLPHARQIGITGHSLAPTLFVAIGSSGRFNHLVGVHSAGTILAINPDPGAEVFGVSDIGIVGDWREVVPLLVEQLRPLVRATG